MLIYSTCTFNAHEDEDNTEYIAAEYGMEKLCERHFIPGVTPTEGLYMCALRKGDMQSCVLGSERSKTVKNGKRREKGKVSSGVQGAKEASRWLAKSDVFDFVMLGGRVAAVKKEWRDKYELAEKKLRVMLAGIEVGISKGRDLVPSQSLALSTALAPGLFHVLMLTKIRLCASFVAKQ